MKFRHRIFSLFVLIIVIFFSLNLIAPLALQAGEIEQDLLARLNNQGAEDQAVRVLVKVVDQGSNWANELLVASKLRALTASRQSDQAEVNAFLQNKKLSGDVSTFKAYKVFNGFVVTGNKDLIWELAARPDVEYIHIDRLNELIKVQPAQVQELTWGIEKVRANKVWQELDVTGSGAVVCVVDTGVDATHPALADNWRGGDNSWYDANGVFVGNESPTPIDNDGHGTHCTGTVCGNTEERIIGVAPDAQWIAARIFPNAFDSVILDAFDWVIDPDDNPDTDDAPDVTSNSWGGGGPTDAMRASIETMKALGILSVFAAGNSGPGSGTVSYPAAWPEVFAIGATDDSDQIASFSSRGPSIFDQTTIKPDVSAPGVNIFSSVPGGGYSSWNGTSMATPHVAGGVALMLEAAPGLTPDQIKEFLELTANDLGTPGKDNDYGSGRVDFYDAVAEVSVPIAPTFGNPIDLMTSYKEGDRVEVKLPVFDPNPTDITVTMAGALPPGLNLMPEPDENGIRRLPEKQYVGLEGTLGYDSVETYSFSITINEANTGGTDTISLTIEVAENAPPEVISVTGIFDYEEGQVLDIQVSASDPDIGDNTEPKLGRSLKLSVTGLPDDHKFFDYGDGTGWVTGKLGFDQANADSAPFDVVFTVTDGEQPLNDTEEVVVKIDNINPSPVIETLEDVRFPRLANVEIPIRVVDPENEPIRLEILDEDVDDDGNLDAAEDLDGDGILDDGEDLDGDGHLDIDEDLNINGTLDIVVLPTDLTLVDNEDGTARISGILSAEIGVYPITVVAIDASNQFSLASFVLTVFGAANYTLTPSQLDLGSIEWGQEAELKEIELVNTGSAPLEFIVAEAGSSFTAPASTQQVGANSHHNQSWQTTIVDASRASALIAPLVQAELQEENDGLEVPIEDSNLVISDPIQDNNGSLDILDIYAFTLPESNEPAQTLVISVDVQSNGPNPEIVGFIGFDIDQDAKTGSSPTNGRPSQMVGVEFEAVLGFDGPDIAWIVDTDSRQTVGIAEVTRDPSRFSLEIPLQLLDGDEGAINISMALGDGNGPTDWAPDAGYGTVGRQIPWLIVGPTTGTVEIGQSQTITIEFDLAQLISGDYEAKFLILHNSPLHPTQPVTTSLSVINAQLPELFLEETMISMSALQGEVASDTFSLLNSGGPGLEFEIMMRSGPATSLMAVDPPDDGSPLAEIVELSGIQTGSTLALRVEFADAIEPESFSPVTHRLLLDLDSDAGTGLPATNWGVQVPYGMGVDALIILSPQSQIRKDLEPDLPIKKPTPPGQEIGQDQEPKPGLTATLVNVEENQVVVHLPVTYNQNHEDVNGDGLLDDSEDVDGDGHLDIAELLVEVPIEYLNLINPASDDPLMLQPEVLVGFGSDWAPQDPAEGAILVPSMTDDVDLIPSSINGPDWLVADPVNGQISSGDNRNISVLANTQVLSGGIGHAHLLLSHNSQGESETVVIPLQVEVIGPNLVIKGRNIDFGPVPFGASEQKSVIIENHGLANLDFLVKEVGQEIFLVTKDPAGDAPESSDIVAIEASLTDEDLSLRLTYAFMADLLTFSPKIFLDTDQDSDTGQPDVNIPESRDIGAEYALDIYRTSESSPVQIDLINLVSDELVETLEGSESVIKDAYSIHFSISLNSLDDDGQLNLFASVLVDDPESDAMVEVETVPDTGHASIYFPDPIPWLSVLQDSGQVEIGQTASLDIEVTTDGLLNGQYRGLLEIQHNDLSHPEQMISVEMQVSDAPAPVLSVKPISVAASVEEGQSHIGSGLLELSNVGGPGLEVKVQVESEKGPTGILSQFYLFDPDEVEDRYNLNSVEKHIQEQSIQPVLTELFDTIDFPYSSGLLKHRNGFNTGLSSWYFARFTGFVNIAEVGDYLFHIQDYNAIRLKIGEQTVLEDLTDQQYNQSGFHTFVDAGRYPFELTFSHTAYSTRLHFEWTQLNGNRSYVTSQTPIPWLSIPGHGGKVISLDSEESINFDVVMNAALLKPGRYQSSILLFSNGLAGGVSHIPASLHVTPAQPPIIAIDPLELEESLFVGEIQSKKLRIENMGEKNLGFHITYQGADEPRLTLDTMPQPMGGNQQELAASPKASETHNTPSVSLINNNSRPIAVAGGSDWDLGQLHQTLIELGYDYVDVSSVEEARNAEASALIVRSGASGSFYFSEMDLWVREGHGLIQLYDRYDYFPNSYSYIGSSSTVTVQNQDFSHPIMEGLPAVWESKGFFSGSYIGYVTDSSFPNLASSEVSSNSNSYDRVVSAASVGDGRAVYIGFNVYGDLANQWDIQLLDNALQWSMKHSWLFAKPSHGVVKGSESIELDVFFDTQKLQQDDYVARLLVHSNDSIRSPMEVPVSLSVDQPTPPQIVIAPLSLTFAQNPNEISTQLLNLSNNGQAALEFNVEVSVDESISETETVSDSMPEPIASAQQELTRSPIDAGSRNTPSVSFVNNTGYPIAVAGGNDWDLDQLHQTLTDLGHDYVDVLSVEEARNTEASVLLVRSGSSGGNFNFDAMDQWVRDGYGLIQLYDWYDYFPNSWTYIGGSPITVYNQDIEHPIMEGLPSEWESDGFFSGSYIGYVTDSSFPNLASSIVQSTSFSYDRVVSATSVGDGRAVYIGFNVYGDMANQWDTQLLDNALRWAGKAWLTVIPSSGVITRHQPTIDLQVQVDTRALSEVGDYTADIVIDSNSGDSNSSVTIPLSITVTKPQISVASIAKDIDYDDIESAQLPISNTGNGILNFEIVETSYTPPSSTLTSEANEEQAATPIDIIPWLTVTQPEGQIAGGDTLPVEMEVDASVLRNGLHSAELTLLSNDPDNPSSTAVVDLTVSGAPVPGISVSVLDSSDLTINLSAEYGAILERSLTIENTGGPGLDFSITAVETIEGGTGLPLPPQTVTSEWLDISPNEGTVGQDGEQEITVSVNTRQATPGFNRARLIIEHNDPNNSDDIEILVDLSLQAAVIAISPEQVNFSEVPFGVELGSSIQTETLTISNTGDALLKYEVIEKNATYTPSAAPASNAIPSAEKSATSRGQSVLNTDNKHSLKRLRRVLNEVEPSQLVFSEDFEEGSPHQWTTETYSYSGDNHASDLWHRTESNFNSPFTSFWCSNGKSYEDNMRNALISPPIDLATRMVAPIMLHFFENYDTEHCCDFLMVDISTDDGTSWQHLRGGAWSGAPRGNSGGWIQSSIDISSYAGQEVRIRFYFYSDGSVSSNYRGWFVDDVLVTAAVIPWLTVSPVEGELLVGSVDTPTNTDILVTVDAYGLLNGSYTAALLVKNNAAVPEGQTDSAKEIQIQMTIADAAPPVLSVFPLQLAAMAQSSSLVRRILTVENKGGPGLGFSVSSLKDDEALTSVGAPKVDEQAVAAAIAAKTNGAAVLRQHLAKLDKPSGSRSSLMEPTSIIIPPQRETFPIIDGRFDSDRWDDSVVVDLSDVGRIGDQLIGQVYAKVAGGHLYLLADYHAITSDESTQVDVVSSIGFDLNLDQKSDGMIGLEWHQSTVTELFDFPVRSSAVGIGSSPGQIESHLIFEYEIPLDGLGINEHSRLAVSFLLARYTEEDDDDEFDDLQLADSGEWPNVSSGLDFLAPDRWGLMYFRGVPWLDISPYSGNLGYQGEQQIDLVFNLNHLQAGTYRAKVVVNADTGENLTIPVDLKVTSPRLEMEAIDLTYDLNLQPGSWQDESWKIRNSGDGLLQFDLLERGASFEALPVEQPAIQAVNREKRKSWSEIDPDLDLENLRKTITPIEVPIPVVTEMENLRTIIIDPAGDTIEPPDIVSVEAGTNADVMTLKINFNHVAVAEQTYGHIWLDTDQNPATGWSWHDIGADFRFYLSFFGPGTAYILEYPGGSLQGPIPLLADGDSIWLTVPWHLIGGEGSDLDIAFWLGTPSYPTDEAPDAGHGTVTFEIDIPWLVFHQTNGMVPAESTLNIPFSIDTSRLTNGIHRAQLMVNHNVPVENTKMVEITITVEGSLPPKLHIAETELHLITRTKSTIQHELMLSNVGGGSGVEFNIIEATWQPELIASNQVFVDPSQDVENSPDVVAAWADGSIDQLVIEVEFADDLANSPFFDGKIFIDGDSNPTTGAEPEHLGGGPNQELGVDYMINISAVGQSMTASFYKYNSETLEGLDFEIRGNLFVTSKPKALAVSIPLAWLENDSGLLHLATVFNQDYAPDVGYGLIEPSMLDGQSGQIGDPTDISWLNVSPANGWIRPSEETPILINVTPPKPGEYYAAVKIAYNSSTEESIDVPITLTVTDQLAVLYVVSATTEAEEANLPQGSGDQQPDRENPQEALSREVRTPILLMVEQPFRFEVHGHDTAGIPVHIKPYEIQWQVVLEGDNSIGKIGQDGWFLPNQPGRGRVEARIGGVRGRSAPITVLRRIEGDSTGGDETVAFPYGQPDGQVDILDLVNLSTHWQQHLDTTDASPAEFIVLDIAGPDGPGQADGVVNIHDLIVLADNFGIGVSISAAPAPVSTLPVFENATALMRVSRNDTTAQRGQSMRTVMGSDFELNLDLTGVDQIKAYSFDLAYDPDQVTVLGQTADEDNANRPSFVLGDLLQADKGSSLYQIARQLTVGQKPDTVNVTVTVLGRLSQNGQGLGQLQLRANSIGESSLSLKNLILVTESGQQLTVPEVSYQLVSHPPVEETRLLQNYPNPFNPETWIPFELKEPGTVLITIYDAEGETIRQLDLGHQVAGPYRRPSDAAYWDGRNRQGEAIASGVYFYHLHTKRHNSIRKMVILK